MTLFGDRGGAPVGRVAVGRDGEADSPAGTVAMNEPNGSASPLTTLRPWLSLTVNSAFRTGSWSGSGIRQLSTPPRAGSGSVAWGLLPLARVVRFPSQRPNVGFRPESAAAHPHQYG